MRRRGWRWWGKWACTAAAVVMAAAWVPGHFYFAHAGWMTESCCWVGVGIGQGTVMVEVRRHATIRGHPVYQLDVPGPHFRGAAFVPPDLRRLFSRPSLERESLPLETCTRVYTPFWLLVLVFAVPSLILWRRDFRHPPGSCAKCGYDLSGSPSGICPECGPPAKP